MSTTINELRASIAALKLQRADIDNAPISKAEREAAMLAWCNDQSAAVHDQVHHLVAGAAYGGSLAGLLQVRPTPSGTVDLAAYFAHLLGADVLARALCKHFADVPKGLSAAERTDALELIDAELFDLELQDEQAVVASELAGAPVARRSDADPRAVLWLDDDAAPRPAPEAPARPAPVAEPAPRRSRSVPSPYMAPRER